MPVPPAPPYVTITMTSATTTTTINTTTKSLLLSQRAICDRTSCISIPICQHELDIEAVFGGDGLESRTHDGRSPAEETAALTVPRGAVKVKHCRIVYLL